MKPFEVVFSRSASADLEELTANLAQTAGVATALGYVSRLRRFCERLAHAAHRGNVQPDGSRVVGFERRVSVRFIILADQVQIAALRYGGRQSPTE